MFDLLSAGVLESMTKKPANLIAIIGPGILVAATGVGAGDLATASFTGSMLGLAVLWAVLLGAAVKYVLNEGLARWQLATGTTFLQGCVDHLGRPVQWLFLIYLLVRSFLVGAMFIPMLACALLVLNGRAKWVGPANRNRIWTLLILTAILLFFLLAGVLSVRSKFFT